jgi:type I restriction enzyme S subunit
VNVADRDYGIGRGLCAVSPRRIDPEYAYWFLQYSADALNSVATGSTYVAVSASDVGDLVVPVVKGEEQRRIAEFLDRETAQIDELIAKQEQLISTLTERLDSLQMQLALELEPVHRGKLGRYLRKLSRPHIPGTGTVTAFRDGQVTLRSNRREEGFTFSQNDDGYQGVEPGDLVFHGLDGFAGAVGVSESSGACSPVYHVCAASSGHDARYLALVLRALGASGFLFTLAANVRQRSIDFRTWTAFAAIPVALPGFEEQVAAVGRFEASGAGVNELVAVARNAIRLLRERRQALISAAVTGQIDVGGAS